jgi:hypothetical protein
MRTFCSFIVRWSNFCRTTIWEVINNLLINEYTQLIQKLEELTMYNTMLIPELMDQLQKYDKQQFDNCNIAVKDFLEKRKRLLPHFTRHTFKGLTTMDLYGLFLDVLCLAGGNESNYIKQEYKTFFVQLAMQIGYLNVRLFPDSWMAKDNVNDLNMHWRTFVPTVEIETQRLGAFLADIKPLHDENGNAPTVFNPFVDGNIYYWSVDDIGFVLDNLEDLGVKFKMFLKINGVNI